VEDFSLLAHHPSRATTVAADCLLAIDNEAPQQNLSACKKGAAQSVQELKRSANFVLQSINPTKRGTGASFTSTLVLITA
jgi:hypothetical protein